MKPQDLHPVHLGADEVPANRAFADPEHYHGDIALLNYLLQDLRVIVRQAARGTEKPRNYESIVWEVHGLMRRTVICDLDALVLPTNRQVVGFFGDRRSKSSDDEVDAAELDVVGEFSTYPGIISYSSIELLDGQWANLVVHTQPTDRDAWRKSHIHIEAAEDLAPKIYHNVRIHNGCVPGGPIGSGTVVIESTKYFDYDGSPMWHAFRRLPGGLTEVVEPPPEGEPETVGP